MSYLTFLDYTTLEATGKNIEAKLSEKEKEIQTLREHDNHNTDAISSLSDMVMKMKREIEELRRNRDQEQSTTLFDLAWGYSKTSL